MVSFASAVAIQCGILLLMWYFCYYSSFVSKPKIITLELGEFQCKEQKNAVEETIGEERERQEIIEGSKPINDEPEPVAEPEPIIDEPAPVAEPEPIIEEPGPVIEKSEPFIEAPKRIIETKPIEKPKPVEKPKKIEAKPKPMPAENRMERQAEKKSEKPVELPTENALPQAQAETQVLANKAAQAAGNEKKISAKAAKEADIYLARVARLFEKNKRYPEIARKKNIKGVVALKFYISAEGNVTSCKAINEPDELLANAATDLVKRLRLPKPPRGWEADRPVIYQIKYNIR